MISSKPQLSAYIRTRNEAPRIADVVRAALVVADEVIVVDSGSTDDTVARAEAAGARVVVRDWAGYGRQKRIAEDLCRHDWLLDLDADEMVSPALAVEIADLFAKGEPPHPVYSTPMAIVPPFGAPWRNFGLQSRRKLYDKRVIRMPAHDFWDQFKIPAGMSVGSLREPLLHDAIGNADRLMTRINKYSTDQAAMPSARATWIIVLRIFFGFPVYFLKRYLIEGLFRGGVYGFAYAMMTAFRRWLKDVKMYERRRMTKPSTGGRE